MIDRFKRGEADCRNAEERSERRISECFNEAETDITLNIMTEEYKI